MVAIGVDGIEVAGMVKPLGGVKGGVLRGVGIIRRIVLAGFCAREQWREVVAPALEIVVEVDFLQVEVQEVALLSRPNSHPGHPLSAISSGVDGTDSLLPVGGKRKAGRPRRDLNPRHDRDRVV